MKCNVCGKDDWFYEQSLGFTCTNCGSFRVDKKQTNADRIRAMNNEELATFLSEIYDGIDPTGFELTTFNEWLEQEVE